MHIDMQGVPGATWALFTWDVVYDDVDKGVWSCADEKGDSNFTLIWFHFFFDYKFLGKLCKKLEIFY